MVIPKPEHEQAAEPGEMQVWNGELRQGWRRERLQGKAIILQPGWTFLLLLQPHCTDVMKVSVTGAGAVVTAHTTAQLMHDTG